MVTATRLKLITLILTTELLPSDNLVIIQRLPVILPCIGIQIKFTFFLQLYPITVYNKTFEKENFHGFHGSLPYCECFMHMTNS